MIRIVSAKPEPAPGYKLRLTFTDGREGVVDLAHLVGRGPFAAWNDRRVFEQVSVDPKTKTVCWPGGVDLDPDVLYSKATGVALPGMDAAA
ncbi:MAG: DUF2442 domain-containing protein [Phycisphaerales bacterium]|nr:DUF2442 domain-containing protein [Phycisphaerales bacterium]